MANFAVYLVMIYLIRIFSMMCSVLDWFMHPCVAQIRMVLLHGAHIFNQVVTEKWLSIQVIALMAMMNAAILLAKRKHRHRLRH